ncbi:MAG: Hpt domain-containing protein [Alphaproteobacteria bacterium]
MGAVEAAVHLAEGLRQTDQRRFGHAVALVRHADIDDAVRSVGRYLDAGDIEAAGRHAHALKSASRNVGGQELSGMMADVEALARAGNIGGMRSAAKEIHRALHDLGLALKTLQARG